MLAARAIQPQRLRAIQPHTKHLPGLFFPTRRKEPGVDSVSGDGLTGLLKARLRDRVVARVEVEVDQVAGRRGERVRIEVEAGVAHFDGVGGGGGDAGRGGGGGGGGV